MQRLKCVKSPNETLALTNAVICAPGQFQSQSYIRIATDQSPNNDYAFMVVEDKHCLQGTLGFSLHQRKWAVLSLNKEINVTPFNPKVNKECYLSQVTLEIDLFKKTAKVPPEPFDAKEIATEFTRKYGNLILTKGQLLLLEYQGVRLDCVVTSLEVMDLKKLQESISVDGEGGSGTAADFGLVMSQTGISVDKAEGSSLKIKGSAAGSQPVTLINPDFNFESMGIGGLDAEFSTIFRRAFASRVFPPDLVMKLGLQHVKGILLYGPPGCGKTLMARQIGKMLNAREPKIVNGPDILDKYVGQSEENIRNLFADAEKEAAEHGEYSALHIIIFDEIDAICKQRGNSAGSAGVGDNVVNQLLSKMDGYERINNVLLIGMTNRKDLIDTALMRPGRLEVQMEINLPDEKGRLQILSIHTQNMRDNNLFNDDVSLEELAELTKNYSGAEIEGVIKAASSYAFYRHVDSDNLGKVDVESLAKMKLYRADFISALKDVVPLFGVAEDDFADCALNGIMHWDPAVDRILDEANLYSEQVKNSTRTRLLSVLVEGLSGAGKTALAATVALKSNYPFIKLISPEQFVGMGEVAKCAAITKTFDDAYKSPLSVIVIDNIERLLEYVPIGPRFSNTVLQTLLVLIKKPPKHSRRLLVIGTTSSRSTLLDMGLTQAFDAQLHVPSLTTAAQVASVVKHVELFDDAEIRQLVSALEADPIKFMLGVKTLIMICEMVRQDPGKSVDTFLMYLREESIRSRYD